MPKKSDAPAPPVPSPLLKISESGSAHAPFVFFDEAPTFGYSNGVLKITLAADRIYPGKNAGEVGSDHVVVAHLRMNVAAAIALKNAIDGALLLARPAETQTKN